MCASLGHFPGHFLYFAVLNAVSKIDCQSEDKPNDQNGPREQGQFDHQVERTDDSANGNKRNERRFKWPMQFWLAMMFEIHGVRNLG